SAAREGSFHVWGEGFHFGVLTAGVAFLEAGLYFGGEELQGLTDVLVAIVAALLDEDRLIDARSLELLEVGADLGGGFDPPRARDLVEGGAVLGGCAAPRRTAGHRDRGVPEALPDVGMPGRMCAEEIVVCQRVAEELEPLEPAPLGLGAVWVTAEAGDHGDV